jgi:hypothetical protein
LYSRGRSTATHARRKTCATICVFQGLDGVQAGWGPGCTGVAGPQPPTHAGTPAIGVGMLTGLRASSNGRDKLKSLLTVAALQRRRKLPYRHSRHGAHSCGRMSLAACAQGRTIVGTLSCCPALVAHRVAEQRLVLEGGPERAVLAAVHPRPQRLKFKKKPEIDTDIDCQCLRACIAGPGGCRPDAVDVWVCSSCRSCQWQLRRHRGKQG